MLPFHFHHSVEEWAVRITVVKARHTAGGFTLIELMITVAVLAILASIAYPSYTQYVTAARRGTDGQAAISELASALEKYYTACGQYNVALGGSRSNCTGLEMPAARISGTGNFFSAERHYELSVVASLNANGIATGYTITAQPVGTQQSRDTDCGSLTLTNAGIKSQTGPNPGNRCWKK